MTDWRDAQLGDLIDIVHGFAFKGEFFGTGGPTRLMTPGNFFEAGGFRDRGSEQKSYDGPVPDGYVLDPGDVVVAMTEQAAGLLGSSGLVPAYGTWLHNQRIGRVVVRDACASKRFVYYLFNEPSVRAQISATATGAKVRHTAPERIRNVRVRCPARGTQDRIAAVLAAFDELIEINERRIELLEGLASSLYREWFVRFRFPGHPDDVPFVESELGSIPEAWSVVRLGDVATLRYGKSLPAPKRRPGQYAVVSSAGIVDEHDEALVSAPGIVVGRKGNIGSVWWVDRSFFPIDTTYYVETDVPLGLMYWQLRNLAFIDSHAAVPGLSRDQAEGLLVVSVDDATARRFDDFHRSCFDLMSTLRRQIMRLAATRDFLLPRLVTGRLDISDVDLGALLPPEDV